MLFMTMGLLPKLGRHEERVIKNRSLSGEKPVNIDENHAQHETEYSLNKHALKDKDKMRPGMRARVLTRMITKQHFEDAEIQVYNSSASNLELKARFGGLVDVSVYFD
jgi:hypothetical protein